MNPLTYTPQPTAAAIDTAISRARISSDEPTGPATTPQFEAPRKPRSIDTFLGQPQTLERGFILGAGVLVALLAIGRFGLHAGPALGMTAPLAILLCVIAHRMIRGGIRPTKRWLSSRTRCAALGVACAPLLTRWAPDSFGRTEKSLLWTVWAAFIIGALSFVVI